MIQPERPPYETRFIRASMGAYVQYARTAAIPFLGLGVYGLARLLRDPHGAELLAFVLAIVAPFYVAIFLHLHRARVAWDERQIWKTGLLGKRAIDRSEVDGVIFRSVSPALSIKSFHKMVVYGHGKHILLILWGDFWSSEDLRAFANAISPSSPDTIARPVSQRDFNREFPTGGSFFGRHPNLSGILGALGFLLLTCLGIAATQR